MHLWLQGCGNTDVCLTSASSLNITSQPHPTVSRPTAANKSTSFCQRVCSRRFVSNLVGLTNIHMSAEDFLIVEKFQQAIVQTYKFHLGTNSDAKPYACSQRSRHSYKLACVNPCMLVLVHAIVISGFNKAVNNKAVNSVAKSVHTL